MYQRKGIQARGQAVPRWGCTGLARENSGNVNSIPIIYNLKIQVCAMQFGRHNDTEKKNGVFYFCFLSLAIWASLVAQWFKNLPANVADTGSIPSPGRYYMLQSN